VEKSREEKLKFRLSDYLRGELSHAGPMMSTAKAELQTPTGVGSSALILPSKPLLVCVSIRVKWAGSVSSTPRVITINGRPHDAHQP
jgi:hypothetical protein